MDLRVALLAYEYNEDIYGSGKYSIQLYEALKEYGVDVDVFSPKKRRKKIGPLLFSYANGRRDLSPYDVVHSIDLSGLMVNESSHVLTIHHDFTYETGLGIINPLYDYVTEKVEKIIVPSYFTSRSLKLEYRGKTTVIPHGVDFHDFYPDRAAAEFTREQLGIHDEFVLINVGRNEPRKGHSELLQVLGRLNNVCLILVGRGTKDLVKTANSYGIKTIQYEYISVDELNSLYNAADLYVHTAKLEGFGLTILEAMATGLPVIAFEAADFKDIIRNSGSVIAQGDLEGMVEEIKKYAKNQELLDEKSRIAKEIAIQYTWEKSAKKHVEVYQGSLR